MIKKCRSLVCAETILNMLSNDERAENVKGYVETFDNCREQGFKIFTLSNEVEYQTIAFCQHRNSDSILVYCSKEYEGNHYSDKFWESGKTFENDFVSAIDYIFELLQK